MRTHRLLASAWSFLAAGLLAASPTPAIAALKPRVVTAPEAVCLDLEAREGVRRLTAGQAVEVEEPEVAVRERRYQRVHLPDGIICLLPVGTLAPRLPTATELWRNAAQALEQGLPGEAQQELERIQSPDRAVLSLRAALSDAGRNKLQSRMLYAQLARLPAQEKPPEPVVVAAETAPPEVGARRHVLATRLRLRLEPREDAPVLAELRLNTAVKVESVEGPFARVVVESVPQRVVHLALAGKPPPRRAGVAATPLKGYAAWAFLAPEPARAERLLEEADAYEASGRAAEAALVLERAALLRPWETELLKRLVRVALASERYGVVAWAALQLSQAGPLASLELVFGCRGSREAAVVLRHPQWLRARGAALPADVCVSDVETGRTCEPCSEANIINTEEENAQAAEAHARELVAWSRAEREREKANAALRKQLAEGPWLRVVLEGSPVHQGAQLWVYGVTAEASGACGNPERPVRQLAHVSQEPLVVPAPGERLVAWVRVPATDGIIYGLVRAKTRTEALEEMKRAVAESSWELTADTGLPAPNIAGTLRLCVGCCGC